VVLSIAATDISRDLHLNALRLGYLFSAFSWVYAPRNSPQAASFITTPIIIGVIIEHTGTFH
jgi:hypothetical protein